MNNKKNKSGLIIVILCIVLLVAVSVVDMMSSNKKKKSSNEKKKVETTENVNTTQATNTTEEKEYVVSSTATNADEEPVDIETNTLSSLKQVKYMDVFYWEKFRLEGSRIRIKDNKKNTHIIKTLDSLITGDTTEVISPDLLNLSIEIEVYDENNNKLASYEIQEDILEIKNENKKYKLNKDELGTLTQYIKELNLIQ
ncbi:MAG: hypothetical protein PUG10_03130 [Lachnospiraceae bacterium]|nr:hypothetical protein [Lachnospiraceae bacterium]